MTDSAHIYCPAVTLQLYSTNGGLIRISQQTPLPVASHLTSVVLYSFQTVGPLTLRVSWYSVADDYFRASCGCRDTRHLLEWTWDVLSGTI